MVTSVALAVSFPYQGAGETYLRSAASDVDASSTGGGMGDDSGGNGYVVLEEDIVVEDIAAVVVDGNVAVDAAEKMSGESSTNQKDNQLPTENDEPTFSQEEESQQPEQTDNATAASFTAKETEKITEIISGLFGPIATDDEQSLSKKQANTTTTTSTTNKTEYSSSCQMELQQADSNLDNIIDTYEYITFLHNVGSISLSTTIQFGELPSEYQVNFDHLATAHTDASGDDVVGIPIGTVEEVQRVCVYISKKGSSAMNEFDWDQISSLP